ncbi:hypothetical protein [Cryptosporangium sp. NPDC051539]|uniref:hypothetical protein n=1 Tax=Cryptosporangium sp. NPDC051539 TaxID=3363962 RepID=UPI0037A4CB03
MLLERSDEARPGGRGRVALSAAGAVVGGAVLWPVVAAVAGVAAWRSGYLRRRDDQHSGRA